ncbi:MAG TPA: DEAD/DEAH box helicase family protein, partial [Methylomirabilota bacterium]|nr:DEAD/DEAH box helicase family protein [Methylomirabilota bacterium]
MLSLRPYQEQILAAVQSGYEAYQKQLVVCPTGGGKTIIFSHLAQAMLPRRTLILAHRDELLDQAIEKLHRATGVFAQKEKADFKASLSAPVVVASIQSMQGKRLAKWPQDHFGLVVVDEAHHVMAASYRNVLRHFDAHAKVVGVTATPDRADRINLGRYFQRVAAEVSLYDLIHQGYLSRISVKAVPLQIDISKVSQKAGDYSETELAEALAPYLRQIAQAIREEATFRKTLVFLPLIATSKAFAEICREEGIAAA